jgi:hypothetical protein
MPRGGLDKRVGCSTTVEGSCIVTANDEMLQYFEAVRQREDRKTIRIEWIERVMRSPEREQVQADGRIRLWARIEEAEGRYLRVVLLPDRETVHNAFFDRSFKGSGT